MENRKGTRACIGKRPAQLFIIFQFLFSIFLVSAGCGAPGDPVPPTPPVPAAIKDLAARQAGDGVLLSFTLPLSSISGEKLPAPPAVEILRGSVKPDGLADSKSFRVVYTIPGALVENYRTDSRVNFIVPIPPEKSNRSPVECSFTLFERALPGNALLPTQTLSPCAPIRFRLQSLPSRLAPPSQQSN